VLGGIKDREDSKEFLVAFDESGQFMQSGQVELVLLQL
jgi:hypothetical protein